jgi:hypothetical protein
MYHNLITRPVIWRLNPIALMALAGMAGPLVLLIADLIAARSAEVNSYNLIRHSISLLAWMPLGWIQTIGFLTIGLLVEVFAAGLFLSIRGIRGFGFGIIFLVGFGFGLLLIGAFHTDVPGQPGTFDGTIHLAATNTALFILPLAILLILPSLKRDPNWRPLFRYSLVIALVALIWMLIYKVWLPADLSWFGLYERILVYIEVLWVEMMAVWLMRLSLREVAGLTAVPESGIKAD